MSSDDRTQDLPATIKPTVVHAAQIAQLGLRGFLLHVCEQGAAFNTLNLAENSLGDAGAQVLCDVLSGSAFLSRLNLHDTALGSAGFERVGDLLGACPQIETLVLSGNRLASACLPDAFCSAVGAAPALRNLQLSGCELTEEAVRPLFESLCRRRNAGLPPLDRLTLSHNRLAGPAAGELCGVIAASGMLGTLDLSHNVLGPAGGEAFSQRVLGVASNGLRRLSVDANGLEVRGCRAIVRLWKNSAGPRLEHLDLRENGLTEAHCQELCHMLGKQLGTLGTPLLFEDGRRVMLSWRDRQGVMNRKAHGGNEPHNVYWHDCPRVLHHSVPHAARRQEV